MIYLTAHYSNGRTRSITADSKVHGGPLQLSRPIPAAAVLHPASIDDARQLIEHLEETIRLMTPPKQGKKRTEPDRNTGFMAGDNP